MTPTAPAATVKRPWSRECMAILKPSPSSPIRFSAGISAFSNHSSPVEPAHTPSLCSMWLARTPGVPFSTMKAVMAPCRPPGSVLAKTRAWSASTA